MTGAARTTVRACTDDDLAAVYAIQLKCPQAAQWREEDYLHLLRHPLGSVVVAEVGDGRVAGFAAFHRVLDEAELRNIAVDHSHRRKGIARALLEAGVRALQESGVRRIFLEVRDSNLPALTLYEAAGFRLLNTRRAYYQDPVEDAQMMVLEISPSLSS
jgi:ribosomal-protein-alanine N-acetyltransferase